MALARAGDIESQPGPRPAITSTNNGKRKYTHKIMCQVCLKGIAGGRSKPLTCNSCKNISHAHCILGLTPEIYDSYKIKM